MINEHGSSLLALKLSIELYLKFFLLYSPLHHKQLDGQPLPWDERVVGVEWTCKVQCFPTLMHLVLANRSWTEAFQIASNCLEKLSFIIHE